MRNSTLAFVTRVRRLLVTGCILGYGLALFLDSASLVRAEVTTQSTEPTALRWKFSKGQLLTAVFERASTTKTVGPRATIERKRSDQSDWRMRVEDVDARGTARITLSFDRFRYSESTGSKDELRFDSAAQNGDGHDPLENQLQAFREVLASVKYTFSLTSRGEVSDIKIAGNGEELVRAKLPPAFAARFMSESAIRNMVNNGFPVLPETPMKLGDTWSDTVDLSHGGIIEKFVRKFTYRGIINHDGKLLDETDVTGTIDYSESIKQGLSQGIKATVNRQENKGVNLFDSKEGVPVSGQTTQQTTFELSLTSGDVKQEVLTSSSTLVISKR